MSCPSGSASLTRRQEEDYIVNRRSPALSAKGKRSEEMIHVPAEAGRNTKSAAEEMLK